MLQSSALNMTMEVMCFCCMHLSSGKTWDELVEAACANSSIESWIDSYCPTCGRNQAQSCFFASDSSPSSKEKMIEHLSKNGLEKLAQPVINAAGNILIPHHAAFEYCAETISLILRTLPLAVFLGNEQNISIFLKRIVSWGRNFSESAAMQVLELVSESNWQNLACGYVFLDRAYQDGHQEVQRFLLQKQPLLDMNKDSLKFLASAILQRQVKHTSIETLPRIKHLSSVLMEISLDTKLVSDPLVIFPLHLAIKDGLDDSVILAILETSSDLALVSYLDSLPIFAALEYSKKYKVDTLMALLNAHKEAANIYDKYGRCALEVALKYKAPEKLILAILNASSGKKKVKIANRLLLAAIRNKYSAEVIASLAKGCTDALLIPKNGKIPIQVALDNKLPNDVILALLKLGHSEEQAKTMYPDKSNMPLHRALRLGYSNEVICALLDAYPNAAMIKKRNGRLPLHVAVLHSSCSKETFEKLVAIYPRALTEVDKTGKTPRDLVKPSLPDECIAYLCAISSAGNGYFVQGNNFPQEQCSPPIAQAIDELRAKILDLSSSITMLATTVAKQHEKTLHEPAQATNPESPLKILELTKRFKTRWKFSKDISSLR